MSDTDQQLSEIFEDLGREGITPSATLRRQIAEIPIRYPRRTPGFWGVFEVRQWWTLASGAALAMAVGGISGWTLDPNPTPATVQNAGQEWNDLSALALAADLEDDWDE